MNPWSKLVGCWVFIGLAAGLIVMPAPDNDSRELSAAERVVTSRRPVRASLRNRQHRLTDRPGRRLPRCWGCHWPKAKPRCLRRLTSARRNSPDGTRRQRSCLSACWRGCDGI